MGTVCSEGSADGTVDSDNANADREAKRNEAVEQLKEYVKEAKLESLCSRITAGMGADDVSALLMSKQELERTINDLDDEYFESHVSEVEQVCHADAVFGLF